MSDIMSDVLGLVDIPLEEFGVLGKDEYVSEVVNRPSVGYWKDAWRRLRKNKLAMIGLCIIIIYTIMAIIGPWMTSFSYRTNYLMETNIRPNAQHWFGTDVLGRDLWARVWVGARISLFIGLVAALVQTFLGILIGGVAGYFGGNLDLVIMRIVDILSGIPFLIFVILIMMVIGSGLFPIIITFAITGWLGMARLVRGQVLQLKEQDFMTAAKAMGASSSRLILKHLIPNMSGVIIVTLTMRIPQAIFTEAFLSYIGLGVKPPMTSWGQLANAGGQVMQVHPYQLLIPAFFISTMMLALQLFGDGLRDALDPKLRK
ncbi:MAG: ABC transporter permease [Eubacteriales bacterium]|nr:ABC transporter permease [Eubacteriales bacterium]